MSGLEPSWSQVVSVWWLITWRTMIGTLLGTCHTTAPTTASTTILTNSPGAPNDAATHFVSDAAS